MTRTSTPPTRSFYERHESLFVGGASLLFILAVWEAAWQAKLISPLFFSGPSAIARQLAYTWTRGNLKSDLVYSGTNFVLGFAAAIVAFCGSARSSMYQSAARPFSIAVPRMNCQTPRAFARERALGLNALSMSGT